MKLGTHTNSLVNYMMANGTVSEIIPGETGATILSWTDRKAATVIETFKKGKYDYIVVQLDDVKRIDNNGMSESQEYEYTPNPNNGTLTFRVTDKAFLNVRKNEETGRYALTGVYNLSVGTRQHYYDYSF